MCKPHLEESPLKKTIQCTSSDLATKNFLQALSDWLKKFHILFVNSTAPPLSSEVERLKASSGPDRDDAYWPLLQKLAALGWLQDLYDLLTCHSIFSTSYADQQENPNLAAEVRRKSLFLSDPVELHCNMKMTLSPVSIHNGNAILAADVTLCANFLAKLFPPLFAFETYRLLLCSTMWRTTLQGSWQRCLSGGNKEMRMKCLAERLRTDQISWLKGEAFSSPPVFRRNRPLPSSIPPKNRVGEKGEDPKSLSSVMGPSHPPCLHLLQGYPNIFLTNLVTLLLLCAI